MNPVDFRNVTLASLRDKLVGLRQAALAAWLRYGPGTTRVVATRSGIDLLTFRPRTTELIALGFVCVAEDQSGDGEGVYRARTVLELEEWLNAQKSAAIISHQGELPGINDGKHHDYIVDKGGW